MTVLRGRASWLVVILAAVGCNSVCPSGTDVRSDPGGQECSRDDDCLVRCACRVAADDELEVVVGECRGELCVDAETLCEDGCGTMDLVAYCRAPD